jgi:hypothetical protein
MPMRTGSVLLVAALVSIFWWSTSRAQDDEEMCEEDCRARHEQCIEVCAEHPNPVQCDSACRKEAQSCEHDCHR